MTQEKCQWSNYAKDNDKNIYFVCDTCGKEMGYDEDRVCVEE